MTASKIRNVLCRPALNQLQAYDSYYLHLSERVSGAQLGLCNEDKLVLLVRSGGKGNGSVLQIDSLIGTDRGSGGAGFVCKSEIIRW